MIALLLLAKVQASSFIEFAQPASKDVTLQAVCKLPELSDGERAMLPVIVRAMTRQTSDYLRSDMIRMTGGYEPKVVVMPDVVRISITTPSAAMGNGITLLESLSRRAPLFQETLDTCLQSTATTGWPQRLDPPTSLKKIKRAEALELYRKVFRPSRITVGVGGGLTPGQAAELWSTKVADWQEKLVKDSLALKFLKTEPPTEDHGPLLLSLESPELIANDVNLSGKFLALIAIGAGKQCTLYRTWREKHAWSYRQEAILSPTTNGWKPRLVAQMEFAGDRSERAVAAKTAVQQDIDNWTENDRSRALGMAQGILLAGVRSNPLYLGSSGPLNDDLEGRTYLETYWRQKTGRPWTPEKMLAEMGLIGLKELKELAHDMVDAATPRFIGGQ